MYIYLFCEIDTTSLLKQTVISTVNNYRKIFTAHRKIRFFTAAREML